MSSEFDQYAPEYLDLLDDPIRERFASGSRFFAERKLLLLKNFFERHRLSTQQMRWLDVGCGQGELLRLGKSLFQEAHGCDLSAGMIQRCRDLNVVQQMEPERLPFPGRSFDLITAVCVYHHVETALRETLTVEVSRVLRTGGVFCIIEHNPFNPVTQLIVRRTPVDANAKLLRAAVAGRLLRSAGLHALQTRYFLYFPERLYARAAGVESWLSGLPLGGQYAVFGRKA